MRTAISRYKYNERIGWAGIFGRILVGFLDEHRDEFSGFDVITPSPSYVGTGATRTFDHTRQIVEAAQIEEPIAWPFAFDVIVKTAPTASNGQQQRLAGAAGDIRGRARRIAAGAGSRLGSRQTHSYRR